MRLVADLHIHSHFSRATSKDLDFEHLAYWAQIKGVQVVGTGDISHPGWLQEMQECLVPAEDGLFRLNDELAARVAERLPPSCRGTVRFMLAGEISNIYKRHGAVRKVHNIVFVPGLDEVERLQAALERIGNIRADGRPILGLDSRDLLELVLEISPRCHLIPAHIWTPWFAMLGSKSGFDSVEACFGDLTPHIFALETGLSSDPPMNWRVSDLDRYTLVSNSDAHSPPKLAREATVFKCELAYDSLFSALQTGDPDTFGGTLEFFPEEGKYHLDGHRKCGICWEPETTISHGGICPVCGKPVTIGVMHRVASLADRPAGAKPPRTHPYLNLIPLPEILAEVYGSGANSKRVQSEFEKVLAKLGPELSILMDVPVEEIAAAGGSRLGEAIRRMRSGEVVAEAGYDGEYGVIKIFAPGAVAGSTPQLGLFVEESATPEQVRPSRMEVEPDKGDPADAVSEDSGLSSHTTVADAAIPALFEDAPVVGSQDEEPQQEMTPVAGSAPEGGWLSRLNAEQRAAVESVNEPLMIVAGPGAGKTRTLTVRIAHLILAHGVNPTSILAITFTNKASQEMAERLSGLLGAEVTAQITVKTFHAFGAELLHQFHVEAGLSSDFGIAADDERRLLLKRACPELGESELDRMLEAISGAKNLLQAPAAVQPGDDSASFDESYRRYEEALAAASMVDFDDLIARSVRLLEEHPDVLRSVQDRYRWISVDEYQDVNLAQVRLLRLLTGAGANLCVIGDPNQAIYGFRGADRRFFLQFAQDFPGTRIIHLRQSYRSPQSLLDAAAQVIARGTDGEAVRLWSNFVEEVKLDLYQAPTDRAEAEYVVHTIEQMVGGTSYFSLDSGRVEGTDTGGCSFGDFAVLYRLGMQSRLLIEAFERSGIPYQAVGQVPLLARPVVRDLLAMLWLLYNDRSRPHLEQLLATDKIAKPTPALERFFAQVAAEGLANVLQRPSAADGLPAAQKRRFTALAETWASIAELRTGEAAPSVAALIERLDALWQVEREKNATSVEHVAQFRRRALAFENRLRDFLESCALQSETDTYDPRAGRVALMTLHAAKGLEFPVVFMVGCEEGLLPYLPDMAAREEEENEENREETAARSSRKVDIEEERRLFYVGMTRAQEKLILTHARRRLLYGRLRENTPSRFIDDIENTLKAIQERTPRRPAKEKPDDLQLPLF